MSDAATHKLPGQYLGPEFHASPVAWRIARALAEGLDGKEGASDDALWLYMRYNQIKHQRPDWSFSECRDLAYAQFVQEILNKAIP